MNTLASVRFVCNVRLLMLVMVLLASGCKRLQIFARTSNSADTYCVYKITKVTNKGTMRALRKGDAICIYCPGEYHCVLNTKSWIKVYKVSGNPSRGNIYTKTDTGINYYLEMIDPAATCTNCPGTNTFQLF